MATSVGPSRLHVRFRFDAALDLFLAGSHRGCEFDWACPPRSSIKHAVEALGVPHTEVGAVLCNAQPASLEQLINDGDRVLVLPAASAPDTGPLRFAADAHLGALARLLRMAGFDTLFDNAWPDDTLASLALHDGRVVLSRDRDLLKRRDVVRGCHLHALDPDEQLRELAQRYGLAQAAQPFRLCLECNAPLEPVERNGLEQRVPAAVLERHRRFRACPVCRRVFWEGSHWQRMHQRLSQALGLPARGRQANG